MFKSYGILHYSNNELRIVLKLEQDISDYYRILVPKFYRPYRQGWQAHLTVVRPGNDNPGKIRYWDKYENEKIEFIYSPFLENGNGFYWFNAWSKRLDSIREELGLINISKFALKPEGFNKTFHCTVAKYDLNFKNNDIYPEK